MDMISGFVAQFPWPVVLLTSIIVTGLLSIALMWACDPFEEAATHLGRNLPLGVKGATINAIGSSMPELFTMVALLFLIPGAGILLVGPGIAVTAGSAVFNSDIIPAVVILSTLGIGARLASVLGGRIRISKFSMTRDFCFMVIAEVFLILILMGGEITWASCAILITVYVCYGLFMWMESTDHDSDEDATMPTLKAWYQLLWSTTIIVLLCYMLAEFVVISADVLGVHPIITALFFGAAASSAPDLIMSVNMAKKGDYEDSISNALGSNTFDICVAMGGPLLVYTLIHGSVEIPNSPALFHLRIGLLVVTVAIAFIILMPRYIRAWQGWSLLGLYAVWSFFVLNGEFGWI